MKITPEMTRRLSALAQLQLTEEETRQVTDQLGDILQCMDVLSRLSPEDGPSDSGQDGALREDRVHDSLDSATVLNLAPDTDGDCIVVPGAEREDK